MSIETLSNDLATTFKAEMECRKMAGYFFQSYIDSKHRGLKHVAEMNMEATEEWATHAVLMSETWNELHSELSSLREVN